MEENEVKNERWIVLYNCIDCGRPIKPVQTPACRILPTDFCSLSCEALWRLSKR